jgi:hypothetical protein
MATPAMRLVDKAFPEGPIRRWVLSALYLCRLLSAGGKVFGAGLKSLLSVVEGS